MRISSLVLLALAVAGCHRGGSGASATPFGGERIACASSGGAFADDCTVERASTDRGLVLTIRRPDGAFRRLLVTHDGRGVVTADGAEAAKVSVLGPHMVEVTLADERYRLPATVGSGAK